MREARRALAQQVLAHQGRGSRKIEHIGSAHDDAKLEALKAAARRLAAGQSQASGGLAGRVTVSPA